MDIPAEVQEVIDVYTARMSRDLPGLIEDCCLFGSVSLDAFQAGLSDLDFLVVTSRKLKAQEVQTLEQIHRELENSFSRMSLDGRYVWTEEWANLGVAYCPYYYFNNGRLIGIEKLYKDSIDAFQIKQYGIPVIGADPRSYSYSIDWDVLTENLKGNLQTYWLKWINKVEKFPSIPYFGLLFKGSMIEWGVLGVSRIYYSIREHDMISKYGAGEYALQRVLEQWQRIVRESINLRNGNSKSLYRSVFKRRQDTLAYMNDLIKECLDA
ncbi:aminoglycoside adenylyltransferase domain-containing protein [Paenibacillus glycanilyticus]|uniref:Adenylyltransferase AadA C-terminal domain-containing protein n=1 Tax=Paenibacillus glycanilyticus TaxID=126569 RepID=A0ABQ6GPM6_9BACL|nr:aminoglycoside adenylyltransferase domain-containing protein [Paenibacillus glycanilyticus]GLX71537.1 hypothetical protein MU1_58870 [Paenibacillus glycanilyticus]